MMKKMIMMITALALAGLLGICYTVMSTGKKGQNKMNTRETKTKTAVFAGGCFWCPESDFEKVEGVLEAVSGYTGGSVPDPTYEQVSGGGTGHVEAVQIIYDPARITYEELLDVFWRHIDPTDAGGQFVDRGSQYRSVIFYADQKEKESAEASRKRLEESGLFNLPIATEIRPLGCFYPAEDYHQGYYKKCPLRYKWYRTGSGRDRFTEKVWGDHDNKAKRKTSTRVDTDERTEKNRIEGQSDNSRRSGGYPIPDDQELKEKLTALQYKVTRENGTEPPFKNEYWDNHEPGIYVDIVSGAPLFSSGDKFESGTGWPSFLRPLEPENIVEKEDKSLFMTRTEVRSRHSDSHLGHVFEDGPTPTGLRYCINSAALRFIPVEDMKKEGYGEYFKQFDRR